MVKYYKGSTSGHPLRRGQLRWHNSLQGTLVHIVLIMILTFSLCSYQPILIVVTLLHRIGIFVVAMVGRLSSVSSERRTPLTFRPTFSPALRFQSDILQRLSLVQWCLVTLLTLVTNSKMLVFRVFLVRISGTQGMPSVMIPDNDSLPLKRASLLFSSHRWH